MGNTGKFHVKIASHALRGGIGVVHLGVFCLEVLKFVHQSVEFAVAYLGRIFNIIEMIMSMKLPAQLFYPFLFVHNGYGCLDSVNVF